MILGIAALAPRPHDKLPLTPGHHPGTPLTSPDTPSLRRYAMALEGLKDIGIVKCSFPDFAASACSKNGVKLPCSVPGKVKRLGVNTVIDTAFSNPDSVYWSAAHTPPCPRASATCSTCSTCDTTCVSPALWTRGGMSGRAHLLPAHPLPPNVPRR